MLQKINKKDKNTLDIMKEVAERYGIAMTECEPGKGGFYDGDKKIELSLENIFDDFFGIVRCEDCVHRYSSEDCECREENFHCGDSEK